MVTVGADPEFLLYDQKLKKIVPCIGIIDGTKNKPLDIGHGRFAHEDNVCLELGFPACGDPSRMVQHLRRSMTTVKDNYLPENLILSREETVELTSEDLDSRQARVFGCQIDYDAYTGGKDRRISRKIKNSPYRYAGGHIHIGGEFNCPPFVAALFADLFLSILPIASGWGVRRTKRQVWYGRPGIFRPKPYGIEYRTPSNWWCHRNSDIERMAQSAIHLAIFLERTSANDIRDMLKRINWRAVQIAINDTDCNAASNVLDNVMSVGVTI